MATKTALITSGAEGLGLAITEALANEGYEVYVTYTTDDERAQASSRVPTGHFFRVDFSNTESVDQFLQHMADIRLDAIVNNASFFEFENFAKFDMTVWDKSFAVNVRAALVIAHRLKTHMNDGGAIVSITTTDAFVGAFASSSWAASKAALISITKSLALNLGVRNIRANAVAVGWVGNLQDLGDTSVQAQSVDITPLRRLGTPSEVADVVCFLVSSKSSFINATTIVVDGGYTAVDIIGQREAETLTFD